MAYFANGDAQEDYEERWCDRCVHGPTPERDEGCAIMLVHLAYNYQALDEPEIQAILDTLIPTQGLEPAQCRLFRAWDPERCDRTPDLFAENAK